MRVVLKRAARFLLTASVLGLTRPVTAQNTLLLPIETVPPAPPKLLPRNDGPLGLSLMLPPALPVPDPVHPPMTPAPSQSGQLAPPVRSSQKPRSAVFATDQVKPSVDLLAVPRVPSSWAADTVLAPENSTKKTPEALPAVMTSPALPRKAESVSAGNNVPAPLNTAPLAPRPPMELTQLPPFTQVPAPVAEEVRAPVAKPAPKHTVASWAGQRPTPPAKTNEWPAAFVENEHPAAPALKLAPVKEPEKVEPRPAEAKGPITAAVLHQKAARACGGLAKDVRIVVRADHSFSVQIQPVNQSAERELIDRLLKVPEMTAPNVHLEVDLTP